MISFAVLLVAVFLGAANAQPERRCIETPVTWSGYIYLIGLREGKLDLRISLANYDRTEEKIKITDIRDYEGGVKRTTLEEYRTKTRYVSEDGNCRKETIEESEFPRFGVPETATRVGKPEYLGSKLPNLGVLVDQFTATERDRYSFFVMAPIGSGEQCVPIMTSELTVVPLTERLLEYTNITTTLPTDAFSLPPGCGL